MLLWEVTDNSLLCGHQSFGGCVCLHIHGTGLSHLWKNCIEWRTGGLREN